MNKRLLILSALTITFGFAACGGDEPEAVADAGTDMGTDTMDGDTTTDTAVDVEEDTVVDPVCGDGTIDAIEDCDGTALGAASCTSIGDFIGGDLACGGDCTFDTTACLAAECTVDGDCDGGVCADGFCVDVCLPGNCTYGDEQSYVSSIQLPPEGEDCCFDFNGDGTPDNGLSGIIVTVGSLAGADFDVDTAIADALADDSFAVMFDYNTIPADLSAGGDIDFRVFLVTNDVDADGEPDQTYDARVGGDGVFQITQESFGTDGPQVLFNGGSVAGGELEAGPSEFRLVIPIPDLLTLDLTIQDARIEGPIAREASGIVSVNEDIDGTTYGGARLGGIVPLSQVLDVINDLARDCAVCGGFEDVESPLIYGEGEDAYDVACAEGVGQGACGDEDGLICGNLGLVCSVGGIIGSFADIDTNANEVNDSISVGMRLGLSGAALSDPAVTP